MAQIILSTGELDIKKTNTLGCELLEFDLNEGTVPKEFYNSKEYNSLILLPFKAVVDVEDLKKVGKKVHRENTIYKMQTWESDGHIATMEVKSNIEGTPAIVTINDQDFIMLNAISITTNGYHATSDTAEGALERMYGEDWAGYGDLQTTEMVIDTILRVNNIDPILTRLSKHLQHIPDTGTDDPVKSETLKWERNEDLSIYNSLLKHFNVEEGYVLVPPEDEESGGGGPAGDDEVSGETIVIGERVFDILNLD
jgi:hypothetical protein